jgi:hypothetical protein
LHERLRQLAALANVGPVLADKRNVRLHRGVNVGFGGGEWALEALCVAFRVVLSVALLCCIGD